MTRAIAGQPVQGAAAPWVEWPDVCRVVDKMWDPVNLPHHSIVGLTGSGKSHLAIRGILEPLCPRDRVLLVDTKGDDPVSSVVGRPVRELPRDTWGTIRGRRPEDYDRWWRLVVHNNRETARNQVHTALTRAFREGNWIIYFDEIRDVTDPKDPGLGLAAHVDVIYRKGRNRRVPIIAATQAPRWVPSSFYDQASFAWLGCIRDEERQKRLREISGMPRAMLPVIGDLQRRQWLLCADNGDYFARTKVAT